MTTRGRPIQTLTAPTVRIASRGGCLAKHGPPHVRECRTASRHFLAGMSAMRHLKVHLVQHEILWPEFVGPTYNNYENQDQTATYYTVLLCYSSNQRTLQLCYQPRLIRQASNLFPTSTESKQGDRESPFHLRIELPQLQQPPRRFTGRLSHLLNRRRRRRRSVGYHPAQTPRRHDRRLTGPPSDKPRRRTRPKTPLCRQTRILLATIIWL